MVGFLSRLFSKGNVGRQATLVNVQRSVSAPELSDDEDSGPEGFTWSPLTSARTGQALPAVAGPVPPQPRRGGVELRRSQTYDGNFPRGMQASTSTRQSMSSSCDGSSLDDQLRRLYGRVKPCHRGRHALIMEGTERSNRRRVIIKAYSKTNQSASLKDKMDKEIAVLRMTAECRGVVRLLASLDDLLNTYLVLEDVPGYTLIEMMANSGGRLPEARLVLEVAAPLLTALAGLHRLGIVHRDIKPEHVLCSAGTIKVVDFCEAAIKDQCCLNHRTGQLEYMAPEVLNKPSAEEIFHQVLYCGMAESELPQYDEKVDVWSAGVLIYEALTGRQPFLVETREELEQAHASLAAAQTSGTLPPMLDIPGLSPGARDFLRQALTVTPAARPSAEQLLRHPWILALSGDVASGGSGVGGWRVGAGGPLHAGALPAIPQGLLLGEVGVAQSQGKLSLDRVIAMDVSVAS